MNYEELHNAIMNSHVGLEHGPQLMKFYKNNQPIQCIRYLQENFDCDEDVAEKVMGEYFDFLNDWKSKPSQSNNSTSKKDINTPTCPKCGSTAITTGARGVGFVRGFLGASETVNRCGNCSYTWKPSRWR